jgi:hypothetical protein
MKLVMAMVLAGLAALPLSVSAQEAEPSVEEPAPTSEPTPEDPWLELELDDDSVRLAPGSAWAHEYALELQEMENLREMELRVKRAKIGLGVSAGVLGVGFVLMVAAAGGALSTGIVQPIEDTSGDWVDPALVASGVVAGAGVVGMIIAGGILAHGKRKLRRLQEAHYATPRRVQWDLARSRLVF